MGVQGRTSWQIGIDQPENLVMGLFVREVAGLKTRHAWLPHCKPRIEREMGEGSAAAAHQWDLWWDRSLSANGNRTDQRQDPLAGVQWRPPHFESLQSAPALQEIVARHFDDAREWATGRHQEHIELMIGPPDPRPFHRGRRGGRGLVETRLVAGLERDLGRPSRPFQLGIMVIPVAERGCGSSTLTMSF